MPNSRSWRITAIDNRGVPRRIWCKAIEVAGVEVVTMYTQDGRALERIDRGHYRSDDDVQYLSRDEDAP
ncbi:MULTISPECIES: hypothetical protein [unclassified Lysobacter]|uniref:hypothetical protein n=1 Tax=unclassified Lysobacter TaxID=2635362 RepID=UPI001BE7D931|nr:MULTISPECIES: hypothetical protein [unclassified Lysobacter]MBT2750037.1 hypothetical protein [Lysobacter sp. ISL-50]MBT2775391.1 hypothetical protein [Lysobacter sp. ISL-54]MBT2783514.1 hypothetical protein [Lysobacter sp. ISL-52]